MARTDRFRGNTPDDAVIRHVLCHGRARRAVAACQNRIISRMIRQEIFDRGTRVFVKSKAPARGTEALLAAARSRIISKSKSVVSKQLL